MKLTGKAAVRAVGGSLLIAPVILELVTAALRKPTAAHVTLRPNTTAQRVLVFFPAFASDEASVEDFLPFFGSVEALLVNYPASGYEPDRLFEEVVKRLEPYRDKELVLYGVSFGSGVALAFRRYLQRHPDYERQFSTVRFIFYSPVTSISDVKPGMRTVAALGYVLRGGWLTDSLWRLSRAHERLYSDPKRFVPEISAERLAEIRRSVEQTPLRLMSTQVRQLYRSRPPRSGEFGSDRALIFTFRHDDVVTDEAPLRLSEAFGRARIVEVLPEGHADVERAISAAAIIKPALAEFLV